MLLQSGISLADQGLSFCRKEKETSASSSIYCKNMFEVVGKKKSEKTTRN